MLDEIPEIPQRELRNQIARVLRNVEAGERFRVTVSGRPVADLVPVTNRPRPTPRAAIERILARAPLDSAFEADVASVVGDTIEAI